MLRSRAALSTLQPGLGKAFSSRWPFRIGRWRHTASVQGILACAQGQPGPACVARPAAARRPLPLTPCCPAAHPCLPQLFVLLYPGGGSGSSRRAAQRQRNVGPGCAGPGGARRGKAAGRGAVPCALPTTPRHSAPRPPRLPAAGDTPLQIEFRVDASAAGSAQAAAASAPPPPPPSCAHCGAAGAGVTLQRCSGCRAVHYCGREHQLAHWASRHAQECTQLQQLAAALQPTGVQPTADAPGGVGGGVLAAALQQPGGREAAMVRMLLAAAGGAEGQPAESLCGLGSGGGNGPSSSTASVAGSASTAVHSVGLSLSDMSSGLAGDSGGRRRHRAWQCRR